MTDNVTFRRKIRKKNKKLQESLFKNINIKENL